MKRLAIAALAVSTGLVCAGTSFALGPTAGNNTHVSDYPAGAAANGIGGSKHNLGSVSRAFKTNGTTEICVFCHTPHHTNTANNLKPLWNRGAQAPSTFTAYGTTLGGTSVANTDIGSTTLACLSCHDGVTTFDNLVNAPGKSGVVAGGSARGWTFGTGGVYSNATMTNVPFMATVLRIGTDLSNDHPVSVAYDPSVAGLRPTDTIISSIDLTSDLAASAGVDGNLLQNRWAVSGYISEDATIASLLRDGKVECSSCHDPHFKNESWDETESYAVSGGNDRADDSGTGTDGLFLRRVGGNTGSGLCRTCHNK